MNDAEVRRKRKMYKPVDPEEYCMNCHAKISGRYRNCEFCGKVWWKVDDKKEKKEDA